MKTTRRTVLTGLTAASGLTATGASALTLVPPPIRGQLSNWKASAEANALYAWLWSVYGKHTITGVQESFWAGTATRELNYIEATTGKLPAILGLDYIEPNDYANLNDRATAWYHESGGIPSICWHWGNPLVGTGYDNTKVPFDLPKAFEDGTPEYTALWRDMSIIADQLTVLRDRGVPVLWRPLHEFTGDWFWWGQHGPEAFARLWRTMYTYFTRERGLDNLIWVLGYAHVMKPDYYPGREWVDIAGADIYAKDHGPQEELFAWVKAESYDQVPICLHENGPIPDPEGLGPDADWLWQLTWHTRWILPGEHNTDETVRKAYLSERYLTLDELGGLFKPAL